MSPPIDVTADHRGTSLLVLLGHTAVEHACEIDEITRSSRADNIT